MQQLEQVVFVDASYSSLYEDDILFVDSTAGAVIITLPVARGGRRLAVSRIAGVNNVTLIPSGTDTINGVASLVISTTNRPVRIKAISGMGYLEI